MMIRYETDELAALRILRNSASVSSDIYLRLGVTRATIKEALRGLADSRETQVVLCGILFATRFKYFEEGVLLRTECQRCRERDSFDHLLQCTGMVPIPTISCVLGLS